uniref:Uncharacterized protein n=1 Tax=Setaria digitata TaxID=48799 RepID=A0A915Q3B1_9BILA
MLQKDKSASRRGRQERFLRYILRRKQCYILLLAELLREMDMVNTENKWKTSEQYKLNFYKCEYEPIWEKPEHMNHDLCSSHYGKGAKVWSVQKTLTNSSKCIHKIHMVPCHSMLLKGPIQKRYDNDRILPVSCGGLFGAAMPYEHITSERDARAPQVSNEVLEKIYMNRTVLSSALQVKCPRCVVRSSWYASPKPLRCRRQLQTLRYGWPYIAKYCDLEEETDLDIEKMIYC